jgi:hypothetical protein
LWARAALPYNRRAVTPAVLPETDAAELLARAAQRAADPAQARWLADGRAALAARFDPDALLALYAGSGRRLRGARVRLEDGEERALRADGLLAAASWSADRAARAALVCDTARACADAPALVARLFRTGDNDERIALLGALPATFHAARFVDTAVDACRTHVLSVFEAIACENPYAAAHFDDPAFNQLVLKALFVGVSVTRIFGLRERANAELARMTAAYASERRAAGRPVPADVDDVHT